MFFVTKKLKRIMRDNGENQLFYGNFCVFSDKTESTKPKNTNIAININLFSYINYKNFENIILYLVYEYNY